jgi:hypothetical protein
MAVLSVVSCKRRGFPTKGRTGGPGGPGFVFALYSLEAQLSGVQNPVHRSPSASPSKLFGQTAADRCKCIGRHDWLPELRRKGAYNGHR